MDSDKTAVGLKLFAAYFDLGDFLGLYLRDMHFKELSPGGGGGEGGRNYLARRGKMNNYNFSWQKIHLLYQMHQSADCRTYGKQIF